MQITTDSSVFDAKADSFSSVGQYKEDVLAIRARRTCRRARTLSLNLSRTQSRATCS